MRKRRGRGRGEHYWVYILASRFRGTLYVGVTNSLERRLAEHKAGEIKGFTSTYGVDRLVFFRGFGDVHDAIRFEKRLKRWRRDWKIRLIEEENPHWADLYREMMALPPLHPDLAAAIAENASKASSNTCHPGFAAGEDRDPSASISPDEAQRRGRACSGSRS